MCIWPVVSRICERGSPGLAALAQDVLRQKPANGAVFAFRGRRGDRIKLLFWDGQGFLSLLQSLGAWPLPLAECCGWVDAADISTARDAVGGDRLATSGLGYSASACGVILRSNYLYLYGALAYFW